MIGLAEKFLHGLGIEPAGDLLGGGDREVLADDLGEAAGLELVLERLACGFSAFERRVGATDRVGERAIRKIVEPICGRLKQPVPWEPPWLGLGLPGCFQHLGGPLLCDIIV